MIESEVSSEHVNWEDTIMLRADYVLGDEEQEIRLFKNTPLKIISLYDVELGENISTDSLNGKTFYA